jgi:thioester reductase-like protein
MHLSEGQVFSGAYSETKYHAEVLIKSKFRSGLKGAVYRLGFVAPHGKTGRFQENIHQNHRARWLRTIVKAGVAPFAPMRSIRMTPVDSVARAMLTLLVGRTPQGETYHVQTSQEVSQQSIIEALHAVGYPIRLLEANEFAEKIGYLVGDNDDVLRAVRRPKDVLFSVPPNGDWSIGELSRLGFEYPKVSSAWFGKFLDHCIGAGFLEAPRFWALGKIVDKQW